MITKKYILENTARAASGQTNRKPNGHATLAWANRSIYIHISLHAMKRQKQRKEKEHDTGRAERYIFISLWLGGWVYHFIFGVLSSDRNLKRS